MKSNNNKYRRSAIGFFLMVLCLIGAACGMRDEDGYAVQDGGTVKTDTSEQEKDASENGSVRIQIYTMDPDSLEAEEISVRVETTDGLTAQIIVDAVVELFEEQGTDIGISGVEQVENTTIVDFDSTKAPLSGVGSSEQIVDSVSSLYFFALTPKEIFGAV